jgi:type IV secretion system protein TrbG
MKCYNMGTLLCMVFYLHCAYAQPTLVNADTRLVTFEFDPDQSYLILTRPKSVTHIQLGVNELINTAVAGDTSNFSVVVTANRSSVLVRPKYEGLTTSLTLITNARSYPIVLRSTPEATGKWYQRVGWHYAEIEFDSFNSGNNSRESIYPISPISRPTLSSDGATQSLALHSKALQAQEPSIESQSSLHSDLALEIQTPMGLDLDRLSQLRSSYEITGSSEFRPLQVFDDGQKMYLHMPHEMQNFPAIFALEQEHAQLINFSLAKHFVVIQGLHSELFLKNGSLEVTVKRLQEREGFWGGLFHGN